MIGLSQESDSRKFGVRTSKRLYGKKLLMMSYEYDVS